MALKKEIETTLLRSVQIFIGPPSNLDAFLVVGVLAVPLVADAVVEVGVALDVRVPVRVVRPAVEVAPPLAGPVARVVPLVALATLPEVLGAAVGGMGVRRAPVAVAVLPLAPRALLDVPLPAQTVAERLVTSFPAVPVRVPGTPVITPGLALPVLLVISLVTVAVGPEAPDAVLVGTRVGGTRDTRRAHATSAALHEARAALAVVEAVVALPTGNRVGVVGA